VSGEWREGGKAGNSAKLTLSEVFVLLVACVAVCRARVWHRPGPAAFCRDATYLVSRIMVGPHMPDLAHKALYDLSIGLPYVAVKAIAEFL
jgi:hypothetical protein